jgi:hypothetical protein
MALAHIMTATPSEALQTAAARLPKPVGHIKLAARILPDMEPT